MGVSNEVLKYMADNYLVVFGHVGALFSGWQTAAQGGYKRLGKTAEDAMKVFRMAYEYQENGMQAMTIEFNSNRSHQRHRKEAARARDLHRRGRRRQWLRDGILDTFNMMPNAVSHAKSYANFSRGLLKHMLIGQKTFAAADILRISTATTWKRRSSRSS